MEIETADLETEAPDESGNAEDLGTESVEEDLGTDESFTDVDASDGEAPEVEYHKVKVGDKEVDVTLDDLRNGYLRQADYTRKTQELAAAKARLQHAESIANSLEADPSGTLRALAQAFGVEEFAGDDFEVQDVDPLDQRLSALEAQTQAVKQQEVRAAIDREIDDLLETHGDFDLAAVIQHAASQNMTVTSAFKDLNYDAVAEKARLAESKRAAKRKAAVVEGGQHRAGGAPAPTQAKSIREAWAQAEQIVNA